MNEWMNEWMADLDQSMKKEFAKPPAMEQLLFAELQQKAERMNCGTV